MPRGNGVFARVITCPNNIVAGPPPAVNDVFLHAMFARLAFSDNSVVEFETKYDPATNTIELYVPADKMPVFNQITGMKRGDNMQCFINWLIGSRALIMAATDAKDGEFVPSTSLQIWSGATVQNIEGNRLSIAMPTDETSTIGYNFKVIEDFQGRVRISLVWAFLGGSGLPTASFSVRTTTNITGAQGSSPLVVVGDTNVPTFNLLAGDIRETLLLETGDVVFGDDIVGILLHRNYNGSPDLHSEAFGVLGLRIEMVEQ